MLVSIVALSIFLACINGLQDAPNAITTTIVTRSLSEKGARIYAAVLNVLGLFFGVLTLSVIHEPLLSATGLPEFVGNAGSAVGPILVSALIVTNLWSLLAWACGMPISGWGSTLSALAGGTLAAGASGADGFSRALIVGAIIPIALSPVLGLAISYLLTLALNRMRRERFISTPTLRVAQTLSAGLVAAGHGISNGRIPLGFITLALLASREGRIAAPTLTADVDLLDSQVGVFPVPWWAVIITAIALGAGTYAGGLRIVHTLGRRLTTLSSAQGFAAETTTAGIMYVASMLMGAPISSTQTVTGSIVGSALAVSRRALSWRVLGVIVGWWLFTPLVCAIAAGTLVALAF